MKVHRPRRTAVAAAAAALALPLTISAVPASAAVIAPAPPSSTSAIPADANGAPFGYVPSYSGYGSYGRYGSPYGGGYADPYAGTYGGPWGDPYQGGSSTGSTTGTVNTSDATAAQSQGLVFISTVLDFGEGEAAGTGIVVDSDGLVVTNHHVVADSTSIKVTDATTGKTYRARVVGSDAKHDVAVLRLVGASGLATAHLDAGGVTTGEAVTAVGDANGADTLTAATGTVIRLSKSITVQGDDGSTSRLQRLIQVDADIIPGDSGGALLDADGDVVGMNVAASEGSSTIAGFVIPVARVERVLATVLAGDDTGAVDLGYDAFLGVSLTSSATLAGVLSGGPAADAGLAPGDTVTAVDGTPVANAAQLRRAVTAHKPGDTVTVTWTGAAGATHSAHVTLTTAPVA